MSVVMPELEYVDRALQTIRYLEHGWPTDLCRWHSHPEYELHLLLCTHGKAFIGDYVGPFRPGSLFLTGPGLPHNWVTDVADQTEKVVVRDMLVQFGQDSLDQLKLAFSEFNELTSMLEQARVGIEFVDFDVELARDHLEAIREARGAKRILALLRFLVSINGHTDKTFLSAGGIAVSKHGNHARIADVVDHITRHFADNLPLAAAAEKAGMSASTFSRNFQKVTDSTFVAFVNRVRIAEACALLYTTNQPISAICYDVGFQNLANFNRTFTKIKNMTPSAYRGLARNELAPKRRAGLIEDA